MPEPMPWVFDDGGRADAGRRGLADDCVTRAIAIAMRRPYAEVYDLVNAAGQRERTRKRRNGSARPKSSARTGVYTATVRRLITEDLGWAWWPTMEIGSGCTVHLRRGEMPCRYGERVIARVSGHYCAVVEGVVHDNHDPTRDGTRCVYGFFFDPAYDGTD